MDLLLLSSFSQEALLLARVSRSAGEVALWGLLRTESLADLCSIMLARREGGTTADHRLFSLCTDETNAIIFLDLLCLGDLSIRALSATILTHEGAIPFIVISVSRNCWSAIVILAVKIRQNYDLVRQDIVSKHLVETLCRQ